MIHLLGYGFDDGSDVEMSASGLKIVAVLIAIGCIAAGYKVLKDQREERLPAGMRVTVIVVAIALILFGAFVIFGSSHR